MRARHDVCLQSVCSDSTISSHISFEQRPTNVLLNSDLNQLLVFLAFVLLAEFRTTDFHWSTLPCTTHTPCTSYDIISESYSKQELSSS